MIGRMKDLDSIPRRVGKRKPTLHKGEIYECSKNSKLIVLDYFDGQNVLIKFLDEFGYEKLTTASSVRKGLVKNPYERTLAGVGYVGVGPYIKGKAYTIWVGVISRCYDESQRYRYPSYSDCTVAEEWHNFQNFAKWFHSNPYYNEGWHLDKDLIKTGNREYGPDNCAFVPRELNMVLVQCGDYNDIGVTWSEDRQNWCAKISREGKVYNLGRFTDKTEALKVYKIEKEAHVKYLADKWKGFIDQKVYDNLMCLNINPEITL